MANKLLWVVPYKSTISGIVSYSKFLWPAVREKWEALGNTATPELYIGESIDHIKAGAPKIVHIQHEFGLFGLFRKYPPFYGFPGWMKKIKEAMPETTFVATAHTVISKEHPPFPWRGHESPISSLANVFLLPYVRRRWVDDTLRPFDAVIVHSNFQVEMVARVCDNVHVIPHVVPTLKSSMKVSIPLLPREDRLLLVFGFIRRSKGQDLAIKALARMKHEASLVIAGSAKRKDSIFLHECLHLTKRLGLTGRVMFTGYVPDDAITGLYNRAVLAIAPFRQSSGSGSLAIALASGTPIIASDISLNKEILEREPGCLALFKSEDPGKLAEEIDRLLDSQGTRASLVQAAGRYARSYSPSKIAQKHVDLYSQFA